MNLHENKKNYSEDSFSFSIVNVGVPSPTIPTHLRTSPSLISNKSAIARGIVALIDPPRFPTFDVLIIFIPQMLVFLCILMCIISLYIFNYLSVHYYLLKNMGIFIYYFHLSLSVH